MLKTAEALAAVVVVVGAGVTVSVVDPVTLPIVAEMLVVPACTADAKPVESTPAVAVIDEAHVTPFVRISVELSLNVPRTMDCSVFPAATDGFAGNTAIDRSSAGVTVNVVDPEILPRVAEIVEVPVVRAVAVPALLIDATLGLGEIAENKPCFPWPRPAVMYSVLGSPEAPPPPHFRAHSAAFMRAAPFSSCIWPMKAPVVKL